MTVKLKSSGWELGGEYLPWVWGQINYWDIERSRWHDVLKTYHLAGHRVVATNVLPSIHQIQENEYDFGKSKPQLDLSAFLNEAKEIGIKVFLWVGPRDCPGVPAAGYPKNLLENETALARDAKGNFVLSSQCFGKEMFALPNLISKVLVETLTPFADALKNAVHAQVHPDGSVIGMGLTQAPGWSTAMGAFAADYSTETVTYYQTFLKKQYSKIANLNKIYGTDYSSFQGIHPPQSIETPGQFPESRILDWARFKEDYFVQAAEKLQAVFSIITGDRIPIFLSALDCVNRPQNLAELEKSRCYSYALPGMHGDDQDGFRIVAQSKFLLSLNTQFAKENESEAESAFRFMEGIASGVRAWDALAPVGAGVVSGFVSNRQGIPIRHKPAIWEMLKEFSETDHFLQSQIYHEVLLLGIPNFERSIYVQKPSHQRLDLLENEEVQLDFQLDSQTQRYSEVFHNIENFLITHQYPFLIADGDTTSDRLIKTSLVIVPSLRNMEPIVQQLLIGLIEKGIHVVLIGELPEHPEKAVHPALGTLVDGKQKKIVVKSKGKTKPKVMKTGKLFHLDDYSESKLDRFLKQIGVQRPLVLDDTRIRMTFHKLRNRIFIAAINETDQIIETIARRDGKFVLKDFWNENKYWGGNGEIKIHLPARQVKFWELITC